MSSSAFILFTAGLAALAPVASAVYTAVGDSPSGNAIYTPTLDEVVPAGKVFDITWNATTTGKISITLCKGPSSDCVTTATIADAIENTGSYSWTPSTDLEPSQPTGYGIELIAADGTYQYSTQFGISNSDYGSSSSSSSSKTSSSTKSVTAKVDIVATSAADSSSTTSTAAAATVVSDASSGNGTASSATGSMTTATKTGTKSSSTGSANGTTTGHSSASSSSTSTGAASDLAVSLGGLAIAAGIAVFAL